MRVFNGVNYFCIYNLITFYLKIYPNKFSNIYNRYTYIYNILRIYLMEKLYIVMKKIIIGQLRTHLQKCKVHENKLHEIQKFNNARGIIHLRKL